MVSFNPRIEVSLVKLIKKTKYMESTGDGHEHWCANSLFPGNTGSMVLPRRHKMGCRIQTKTNAKERKNGISARACWRQKRTVSFRRGPSHNGHSARIRHKRSQSLVSVHACALRVAAQLPVRGGADGPAATGVATGSAAFLQGKQLLGTEGLVVDLAGSLDQILKVGAGQEVAQVDEFTVVLVLDVDDTPAVLAAANLLAVDNNGLLTADNGERNDVL